MTLDEAIAKDNESYVNAYQIKAQLTAFKESHKEQLQFIGVPISIEGENYRVGKETAKIVSEIVAKAHLSYLD